MTNPFTFTFRALSALVGLSALLGYINTRQLLPELTHEDNSGVVAKLSSDTIYVVEQGQVPEKSDTNITVGDSSSGTISTESPLFVLSLLNSASLAIPRYFECAGYNTSQLGRLWTGPLRREIRKTPRQSFGQCMTGNLVRGNPILWGCGDYSVYTDLQFLQAPQWKPYEKPAECFDPVLYPGALEKLHQQYPIATIVNVVRDPVDWFQSLSPQIPTFWNEWCNPTHRDAFPKGEQAGLRRSMVGFYMKYQHRLRQFAKDHPTWNYIEVDLQEQIDTTAAKLQQQLGIPSQCWIDSIKGNLSTNPDQHTPSVLQQQPRPNDVGWPILVTAMPKAGTSSIHDYFRCGLGDWASAHQWTTRSEEPYDSIAIGECMLENTIKNHYPILDGCGDQLVWSDTGLLRQERQAGGKKCYFPFLHRQGLERFYKSYPYGTLLNVVRNSSSWVASATKWYGLPNRWVKAQCRGFPTTMDAPFEEWEAWYNIVQARIRRFAKKHPTLTYIELPLNDQTGSKLHDIFRFPKQCWGHANANTKIPV